jgi:hypothetical protein
MRALLLFLCLCSAAFAQPQQQDNPLKNHDPEKALITADDIALFWKAYDLWAGEYKADPARLPEVLQKEYLDKGSVGVQDFIPHRIESAKNLSAVVLKTRFYYEGVRRNNNDLVRSVLPELRKDFAELKRLYPDAVFPPVYFVIGALTSGGTSSRHGLIIGAEMLSDQNPFFPSIDAVGLVMHELTHYQQIHPDNDLLATCMREGTADFVAELASGHNLNARRKVYGDSHEEELWAKFQEDTKKNQNQGDWLYNYDKSQPDLGYYMGYKISQALYQSAKNKSEALRMIIEMRDPQKIYELSGYGKRFSYQEVK